MCDQLLTPTAGAATLSSHISVHRNGIPKSNETTITESGPDPFRMVRTPRLSHGWDASVLFEETQKTLLCSDLFHQTGEAEPMTISDVVERSQKAMMEYERGVLAEYAPYTPNTAALLDKLAALKPERLAIMHGSSFEGDGARALTDLGGAFKAVFGNES